MFAYCGGMSLAGTTEGTMSDTRSPEDRVADLVGLLNVVTAELVGVIGEVIRAGAWEGFGIRSPEHWVVWRCGVSPGRARRLVRMARALDALPATSRLFQAGELGEDQTALIVQHTDAEHDAQVAELAPSLTVPQRGWARPRIPAAASEPRRCRPSGRSSGRFVGRRVAERRPSGARRPRRGRCGGSAAGRTHPGDPASRCRPRSAAAAALGPGVAVEHR
jgi:Domain of unknown function (DUF222)